MLAARRSPSPPLALLVWPRCCRWVGSLAVDALLVWVATNLVPSTRGYVHFRFPDYGLLTTIGVFIACRGVADRGQASRGTPRWLFFRLAVVVTLVLWIPDIYLIVRHQSARAVTVLMAMHLAIALSPTTSSSGSPRRVGRHVGAAPGRHGGGRRPAPGGAGTTNVGARPARHWRCSPSWSTSLIVGIAVVVSVPTGRPSGWLPMRGQAVYLIHTVLGFVIAVGALVFIWSAPAGWAAWTG